MDRGSQVEDVVAHCQVVLQAEGLKHYPVSYWEGQSQFVIVAGCGRRVDRTGQWGELALCCPPQHPLQLEGGHSPGGGGSALMFGLMSGGKGGLTSWLGDR